MRRTRNYGGDPFGPGGRPPLEALPTEIAKLATEYDAALVQVRDAERERERLAHRDRDDEARKADAAAAAAAARAGKKIPPATAAAKLESDRDDAIRAVDAHRAAVKAIVGDLDEAREAAVDAVQPPADNRDRVEKAAAEFVAVLEETVAGRATYDWMRGRGYDASARTWVTQVVPELKNHGMGRTNGAPTVSARHVVTNLVTAMMED